MLKTFNAILTNNVIQWLDETPEIKLDNSVKIQVTFLEEKPINTNKSNGKKMAEALKKISQNHTFANINPSK